MSLPDAERAIAAATAAGRTIAVAESLTGGAVCAALVEVAGASAAVKGGIVAYDAALKVSLLGVPQDLLDTYGPVSQEVASAMASGVCVATGADIGVATTGAAGPDAHGGRPPGTVFVAIRAEDATRVIELALPGDREAVRGAARDTALRELADTLVSLAAEPRARREQA